MRTQVVPALKSVGRPSRLEYPFAPVPDSVDLILIAIDYLGRRQALKRQRGDAFLVACLVNTWPLVENMDPSLVRPFRRLSLRAGGRKRDRIAAHDAREIAQSRCEDSEALASIDVARAAPDRGHLLRQS